MELASDWNITHYVGIIYDPGILYPIRRSIYSKNKDDVIKMKYQVQVFTNAEEHSPVLIKDACPKCHFAGQRYSDGLPKDHRCTNCGEVYYS